MTAPASSHLSARSILSRRIEKEIYVPPYDADEILDSLLPMSPDYYCGLTHGPKLVLLYICLSSGYPIRLSQFAKRIGVSRVTAYRLKTSLSLVTPVVQCEGINGCWTLNYLLDENGEPKVYANKSHQS